MNEHEIKEERERWSHDLYENNENPNKAYEEDNYLFEDKKGNQHLDLCLKSMYNFITSWETGEELPDGDSIHWVSPHRVEIVIKK